MDLKEALNIIGLPKTASNDELKVKYKELAKKYHPDVYKEDPNKFKKINEAYQLIQDYKTNPDKYDRPVPPVSPFRRTEDFTVIFEDFFPNVRSEEKTKTFSYAPLNITSTLSFKESVLGANKEVNYKKYIKCSHCNARGTQSSGNGCQSCNGFGRIVSNNKGMTYNKVCTKCFGKDIKISPCAPCNSIGVLETNINITIHIPPGTVNGSTLRLRGAGHFMGTNVFGDLYTDVYVYANVIPEAGLSLEGSDVVSHLNVTLLEALTGCSKEVRTIFNNHAVEVPAGTKNKDEFHIKGYGVVSADGVQRVIFDVEYPSNTEDLIRYLKDKEN